MLPPPVQGRGGRRMFMYTLSENCPRKDVCVQNGKGLVHIKHLTDKEGLYLSLIHI